MTQQRNGPQHRLSPDRFRNIAGHCWATTLPDDIPVGDNAKTTSGSGLILYENGVELQPWRATHDIIARRGLGAYSHWESSLYFSTSDNTKPAENGRTYEVVYDAARAEVVRDLNTMPLFPILSELDEDLKSHNFSNYQPARQVFSSERLELAEAKIEYLLDEIYRLKSIVRHLAPQSDIFRALHGYQLQTFDYQWDKIRYHDEFMTNEHWKKIAAQDVTARLGVPSTDWFKDKTILDCGCGPGRHTWIFAKLGARVTAFDMSDAGLSQARAATEEFGDRVTLYKHDILEPIPFCGEADLVWSYGVVHCTIDPFQALANIAQHVRLGGTLYVMVYPEPRRDSIEDYKYRHQVNVLSHLLKDISFDEKAAMLQKIGGAKKVLGWFDAASSRINELYDFWELRDMLHHLGFGDVRRTCLEDASQNVVATRVRR